MKISHTLISATFLVALGYSGMASAHNQSGTLGSAASGAVATDIYSVDCSDDGSGAPAKLFAQVKDAAPVLAPTVSIQLTKTLGVKTDSTAIDTDSIDGDALYSTGVTLTPTVLAGGGLGTYKLIVTKSQSAPIVKGIEIYDVQFHCQTASGAHTGTTWVMKQNQ